MVRTSSGTVTLSTDNKKSGHAPDTASPMLALQNALSFIAGGRECAVCGEPCGAVQLCRRCQERLGDEVSAALPSAAPPLPRCRVCGKLLVSEKDICMRCRDDSTRVLRSTERVLPLFPYRLWMQNLLVAWKDEGERALSPFFAQHMARAISSLGCTVIVPVPPRRGKLRKKGWDQIDDLCTYIKKQCRVMSVKQRVLSSCSTLYTHHFFLHSTLITRCYPNATAETAGPQRFTVLKLLYRTNNVEQKSLSAEARLAMVKSGTYRVKEGKALGRALRPAGGVMPRHVCLIDDVLTTGATLESCAAALRAAGVQEVDVVTLFVVD